MFRISSLMMACPLRFPAGGLVSLCAMLLHSFDVPKSVRFPGRLWQLVRLATAGGQLDRRRREQFCSAEPRGLCGDLRVCGEAQQKAAGPRKRRVALRYIVSTIVAAGPARPDFWRVTEPRP